MPVHPPSGGGAHAHERRRGAGAGAENGAGLGRRWWEAAGCGGGRGVVFAHSPERGSLYGCAGTCVTLGARRRFLLPPFPSEGAARRPAKEDVPAGGRPGAAPAVAP